MERKLIVYHNLIRLLKNLTIEDEDLETYHNLLTEPISKSELVGIAEDINTYINEILKTKIKNELHKDFDALNNKLTEFQSKFSSYAKQRINEIFLLIKIISKLNEATEGTTFDLTLDEDINVFCLAELKKQIQHKNYHYYDAATLRNSIVLIDFSDMLLLQKFISEESISIDLMLQLMAKIGEEGNLLKECQYVLVDATLIGKAHSIWAFTSLHVIRAGHYIHRAYEYTFSPQINPSLKLIPGKSYQQFQETLTILSEYNSQVDILDKYIRIYHVFENFMYKFQLVALERKHGGTVFSIRDFQRMYDKISKSEISVLKKLMQAILLEEYDATQKFSRYIFNKWTSLYPAVIADKTKIDKLLSLLRVTNNKDEDIVFDKVELVNISSVYADIIYSFRNSLVHNRETEFHLTHETLLNHSTTNHTAKDILETFLIPTMEEIAFFLIIKQNEIVWYDKPDLKLWMEN